MPGRAAATTVGFMRAIQYDDGPESIHVAEVADPTPGPGEVLIEVAATAVNRADLLQSRGLYPPPPGASEVLGLECSGRIASVGDGVEGHAVGDEVCALLAGGAVWSTLARVGGLGRGSLAADARWGGAGLGAPRILIHGGTGGIGSHAVQVSRALGARVATTAGGPEKVEMCRELGAELAIDYRDQDFVDEVKAWTDGDTRGRGVDLILDVMGAKYLERNVASLAPDGRLIVVGMQGGMTGELNLGALLSRRAGVMATNLRKRPVDGPGGKAGICTEVVENVWPMVAAGDVTTRVSREFPLERAAEALAHLESGEAHGKLLLTTH